MKSRIIILVALIAITTAAITLWLQHRPEDVTTVKSPQSEPVQRFNIAIVSIVEIEPIAQLRSGFKESFAASKFAKDRKVIFAEYNAQGDSGLINQIADKISVEKPDLVYVLGTPIAQAIQKRAPDLLILQGAVTDPVEAGLAESWNGSGKLYIATSDLPPIPKQVDLISELTPSVKRLGIIYNPGETNSVAVVSRLREYLDNKLPAWELVERPIASTSEVSTSVQSLLGKVDAIYLPPDNTAHAAIPVIGRFCLENDVPFYATVENALEEGALATLALDFTQVGRESAGLALAVLNGQDPATTPILINENPSITISKERAQGLRLDLSQFQGRPNVRIK